MTAPLRTTQYASSIAAITASQNTAPVAEFRCLFTQDIRRKQKRWQDGYLKFHTFNNRVMVYDQARNFLGDTYYKDSNELQEGDELSLNNGALVEVAEAMGITHTDLTPLLEKKNKDAPPRPSAPSQPRPFQRPSSVAPTNAQRNGSQLRHKSLNTLLGTPKGPIGKAQPMKSPYETRKEKEKEKENEVIEERATKRQKTAHRPQEWRASSPVQEESPAARSHAKVPARKPIKFIPPTATVITIHSEPDPHPTFLSDVSMPSTPLKVTKARAERRQLATPAPQPVSRQPPAKTPRVPKGKVPIPSVKALETPKQRAPPSSPPVSASNRLSNVNFAIQLDKETPKEPTPPREPEPPVAPPAARKPKSLRLSKGVKRGRLLCQALVQQAPTVAASKANPRTSSHPPSKEPSPALNHENDSTLRSHVSGSKRKSTDGEDVPSKRLRVSKSHAVPSPSLCEDPEVIHGRMDQQLLVSSSPVQAQVASSPVVELSEPKPTPAKKAAGKKAMVPKSPEAIAPQPKSPTPKPVPRKTQARKAVVDKCTPAPPPAPVLDTPRPAARDASPTHTEPSEAQSRVPPAQRNKKQPLTTNSLTNAAIPSNLLRANRNCPFMSTTQLAAIIQHPENIAKILADPIEEETNVISTRKSSNRAFRRVRSEHDAPIPSIAEEWEKRNLPKPRTDAADQAQQSVPAAVTAQSVLEPPKKIGGLSAAQQSVPAAVTAQSVLDPPKRIGRLSAAQQSVPTPVIAQPVLDPPKRIDGLSAAQRSVRAAVTAQSGLDPPKKIGGLSAAQQSVPTPVVAQPVLEPPKKIGGLSALIKKTDPRRKFKRTQSLHVDTSSDVPETVVEAELPSPVVDPDVGPWSTEAGDLFDWRPPGREKKK